MNAYTPTLKNECTHRLTSAIALLISLLWVLGRGVLGRGGGGVGWLRDFFHSNCWLVSDNHRLVPLLYFHHTFFKFLDIL